MTDETDISTANTMRERSGESRIKLWLLLRANRLLVSSILTSAVFVAFIIAVAVLDPPFSRQIESGDMTETIFSTMITVIVTGTTLVVTIGQLVLSQGNSPLGDQRERMASSMDVRDFTEELIGSPSPPIHPNSSGRSSESRHNGRRLFESLLTRMITRASEKRSMNSLKALLGTPT